MVDLRLFAANSHGILLPMRQHAARRLGFVTILLVCVGVACSMDVTSPIRACTAPLQSVTVESPAGSPQFTWTPNCGVSLVTVEFRQYLPPSGVWSVYDSLARIVGPVSYGQLPSTARVIIPPETLARGYAYRVYLLDADLNQLGFSDFVP
jgi:hypothetical protein